MIQESELATIRQLIAHHNQQFVEQGLSLWGSLCDSLDDFEGVLLHLDVKSLWKQNTYWDRYKRCFKGFYHQRYIQLWVVAEYCGYNHFVKEIRSEIREVDSMLPTNFSNIPIKHLFVGPKTLLQEMSPLVDCASLESLSITAVPASKVLPEWLLEMHQIHSLSLAYLGLSHLPKGLSKLHSLREIFVEGNILQQLPEDWRDFGKRLQRCVICENAHLSLENVDICTLEMDGEQLIKNIDALSKMTFLSSLSVMCMDLRALPAGIKNLVHLQELDLEGNLLSGLPRGFGQLTALRSLNLRSNELSKVPNAISKLSNLETLRLGSNEIEVLPSFLSQLPNLQVLDLTEIYFFKQPKVLEFLPNVDVQF